MSSHSTVVGGSSAQRIAMCPASVGLSKDIPPRPSSPYAMEGTALHAVMEQMLLDDSLKPDDFIGRTFEMVEITEELAYGKVRDALEATNELFKQLKVEDFEPECVVRSSLIDGAFGTCDIIATTEDDKLVIADYKFGDGVIVSPEENRQLMFYAAVALEDAELDDWLDFHPDDTVVLAIIQPAADPVLQTWETTVADVSVFLADLSVAVSQTGKPDLEPHPGDWCRWCPALPVCPAHVEKAKRLSAMKTETAEDLAEALTLVNELDPFMKAVRKMAHERMEIGDALPGFKLVRTDARRKWTDEEGAKTKLKNSKKLVREDYLNESMVSPPQLEKVCKQKGVDFGVFADYYDAVSSGTAVVPESHPKKAIATADDKVALG